MTDGIHLLAVGVPITLLDGEVVNVRYGMRGIALLESEFGTMDALQAVLNGMAQQGTAGKYIRPLCRLLACGLSRAVKGGGQMTAEQLEDAFIDRLDVARCPEYEVAIAAALRETFPTAVTAEEPRPNGTGRLAPATSPGGSTGTSGSSGSGSRRRPSGT